ncbi:MAG TPA: hypothetical protein PKD61_05845 [Polyangiaceae bacterium]|nr:hypothetical protein [Polyangiaceae bacterium]
MKKERLTRTSYAAAYDTYVPERGVPATRRAEQQAKRTGKLNALVDPAHYNPRRSLISFVERPDGLFEVGVGLPVPIETRLDTTGSMGGNVDKALKVLPDLYELACNMLPGCDPQLAIGIFGDVVDDFVLCRPQFEMTAEKIVEQLTMMVPERGGGDFPEDPHYGLFGGAYLTAAYINRIGLKRFDFTVSDAPARSHLDSGTIRRVFGDNVYEVTAANGHQVPADTLLDTKDVANDLLKQAHAFFLQVNGGYGYRDKYDEYTFSFWADIFGSERVIQLPRIELLPQVQASIIGLTHGTLTLGKLEPFLRETGVGARDADAIVRSVANIPIAPYTEAELDILARAPKAGDVFREKTDLWPMDPSEVPALPEPDEFEVDPENGPDWL